MSLAGWTEYYYLISCTLSPSFFLSCFSDILMLDWDICCGVLHSSLLVAWLCCCCCAGNYWRNPRCQSCHLWQPTHAAFRSLCTNQRTSAGQSRAIVELFSCSQLAQTSPDLMLLPFTSPCPTLFSFPFQSFVSFSKPSTGSGAWNKCLPSLPASVVNSERWPPSATPFLLFLIPPPLVSAPPRPWKPFRSLFLSCTFCFGLWRKSVAQFSLRVCCCCFRKVFFIFFSASSSSSSSGQIYRLLFIIVSQALFLRQRRLGNRVETLSTRHRKALWVERGGRRGQALATQFAATSKAFKIVCSTKSFTEGGWGV